MLCGESRIEGVRPARLAVHAQRSVPELVRQQVQQRAVAAGARRTSGATTVIGPCCARSTMRSTISSSDRTASAAPQRGQWRTPKLV